MAFTNAKKAILHSKIGDIVYELLVKTSTDMVFVGDNDTTLASYLANLETVIGGKATPQDIADAIEALHIEDYAAQDDLDALAELVGELPTGVTATTVVGYIAEAVNDAIEALNMSQYATNTSVDDKIAAALSSTYKPGGSLAPAGVVAALLVAANEGKVYNLSAALTLDATSAALFVDGKAGDVIAAGSNIVVINTATTGTAVYKFDQLAGFVDLSGKADKVTDATAGNFATLDANGNIVDSGKKPADFLTEHQDISGKADKDTDAVSGNFAMFDANGNPVDSGHKHSDYLTEHQDITGKADKPTTATTGNLAKFDASKNPVDAGIAINASDLTNWNGKSKVYYNATQPSGLAAGDLWVQLVD